MYKRVFYFLEMVDLTKSNFGSVLVESAWCVRLDETLKNSLCVTIITMPLSLSLSLSLSLATHTRTHILSLALYIIEVHFLYSAAGRSSYLLSKVHLRHKNCFFFFKPRLSFLHFLIFFLSFLSVLFWWKTDYSRHQTTTGRFSLESISGGFVFLSVNPKIQKFYWTMDFG